MESSNTNTITSVIAFIAITISLYMVFIEASLYKII